jgi:glycosyltransferase involved in cell wall biosynthesis
MSGKKIIVYFPAQYPKGVSPSQRFRLEQYEFFLLSNNIEVITEPFISSSNYNFFFSKGYFSKKVFSIIMGFLRRTWRLFKLFKYDYIFINREASPIGPPIFEWVYSKVLRKKIIYDIDDAVWLPNISSANKIAYYFKCFWKVKYIIKWSHVVIGGNTYLCNYAKQYNHNTYLIPTTVDTINHYNKMALQTNIEMITIGWTGSFSTMKYLEKLVPVFKILETKYLFKLLVISNKKPTFTLNNLEFIEWSEQVEVSLLSKCNIGVMPMEKDEWGLGKCGFKIIQYMALGIVPVAENWGANGSIVENNVNGFLADSEAEWIDKISLLIEDEALRKQMSLKAIKTAGEKFSVMANEEKYLNFLT